MAVAMATLVAATWGGLHRLGWQLPGPPKLPGLHGPAMILGFLGTLISLERAVALQQPWAFAAPALAAAGALSLLAGLPLPVGQALLTAAGLGLVAAFVQIYRLQPALHTATMGLAAALWAAGGALWWGGLPVYRAVPWWAGFLILTIAGERLELARLARPSPAARMSFAGAVGLYLAGLALSLAYPSAGFRLMGVGLLAQSAWLGRYDIARRTVRQQGLPRFIAACLLSGYVWLAVAGLSWLAFGAVPAGPRYDAMLHAVFLGYVFSMIFGHAPVIIPAILGVAIPFRPSFYLHLAALHGSLALRVAGDVAAVPPLTRWGGLLNALAIPLFLASTARAARAGRRGSLQRGSGAGAGT